MYIVTSLAQTLGDVDLSACIGDTPHPESTKSQPTFAKIYSELIPSSLRRLKKHTKYLAPSLAKPVTGKYAVIMHMCQWPKQLWSESP